MTITKQAAKQGPLTPNGVTTTFPFNDFQVANSADVVIIIDGVEVSSALYTVSLNSDGTGSATFAVAPTGSELYLYSDPSFLQSTNYGNQGPYYQADLNQPLDNSAIRDIAIRDATERSVRFKRGTIYPSELDATPNTVVGIDLNGDFGLLDGSSFKGDPGGNVTSVGTFSQLSLFTIPVGTDVIHTSGYSSTGIGGGRYVSDALANAGLALAHPLFCKVSADGRYWRLTGWEITFEQGGASATAGFDNRPAIMGALNYGKAVGVSSFRHESSVEDFELWAPTLSMANADAPYDVTGPTNFVTISADCRIDWNFCQWQAKAYDGTSIETTKQAITGNANWRGHGFNVIGGTVGTASFGIKHVVLLNGRFHGGCTRGAGGLADSDHASHKGFRIQDTGIERLTMVNMEFYGWRGECIYLAQLIDATIVTILNCKAHTSNQSALNPSSGNLTVIGGEYGNAPLAIESLGGVGQTFIGTRFYNSDQATFSGGRDAAVLYNYGYPNRDAARTVSMIRLRGCQFDKVTTIYTPAMVEGDISVVDGTVEINALTFGSVQSIKLSIRTTIDRATFTDAVRIAGATSTTTLIPGAPAGNYILPVSDVHIDLMVNRTEAGKANSKAVTGAFGISGLFDQDNCTLRVLEAQGVQQYFRSAGTLLGMPLCIVEGNTDSHLIGGQIENAPNSTAAIAASPYAMTVNSASMALLSNTAGTWEVQIVNMATRNYADGQMLYIMRNPYSHASALFVLRKNLANVVLKADRWLVARGDILVLKRNKATGLWHEVNYISDYLDLRTVANLPAASATYKGQRLWVSDATQTLTAGIGAVVAGGGANTVPVVCDGTNWRIG